MKDPDRKKKNSSVTYLKYAGMAFQLLVLLAVAVIIGQYIDKWVETEQPIFTIITLLVIFTGYIYKLYKDLMN